jgi:hypothetical protein
VLPVFGVIVKIMVHEPSVIVLIADGIGPDVLDAAIHAGDVPELAALRELGGRHLLTTVFPSVTGVAYIPMLTGRHPADVGVPGLRWYDRSRRLPAIFGHSRSYVGAQLRRIDDDLAPGAATLFEHEDGKSLGCAAMVTRGLPRHARLDRGWWYATRVAQAHLAGSVDRWAALEEALAATLVTRIRREHPRFVFASFTAGDKAAHAQGTASHGVRRCLAHIDRVVGAIRRDAERDGRWSTMQLFVVSDHGHSPVQQHFDLAGALTQSGMRVRTHPWTTPRPADAAVMVSGNAMAHVYLGLEDRVRSHWTTLERAWASRVDSLLGHEAIDLVATWRMPGTIGIRRGSEFATIELGTRGTSYRAGSGNPLGLENFECLEGEAVRERTMETAYPDSIAQLASLVTANRSGDLIVSASPGWDLRQQYEPIDHVSSHGALHAAHMLVPLLVNQRPAVQLRRTSDLYAFTLHALGAGDPPRLERDIGQPMAAGGRSAICAGP